MAGVDLVDRPERRDVGIEDRRLDEVVHRGAGLGQHGIDLRAAVEKAGDHRALEADAGGDIGEHAAVADIGPGAHDDARRFLLAMIDAGGRDNVLQLIARADRLRKSKP